MAQAIPIPTRRGQNYRLIAEVGDLDLLLKMVHRTEGLGASSESKSGSSQIATKPDVGHLPAMQRIYVMMASMLAVALAMSLWVGMNDIHQASQVGGVTVGKAK